MNILLDIFYFMLQNMSLYIFSIFSIYYIIKYNIYLKIKYIPVNSNNFSIHVNAK